MRWVTGHGPGGGTPRVGLVREESVHWAEDGLTMLALLEDEAPLQVHARRLVVRPSAVDQLARCTLLAPLPNPPSIRDFSSFEQHISITYAAVGREIGDRWKTEPSSFFLNAANVGGPDAAVLMPSDCEQLDFEVEVAAILGHGGRNLSPSQARDCIAGFTILNDWSSRDIQRREMARGLGATKAKDFATTMGPWLVTPDAFDEEGAVASVNVNGREYGRGRLADMWWSLGELVAHASMDCTLRPGEIIASGTFPNGCILELSSTHGSEAYPWLAAGDRVEVAVEGLGVLRNTVSSPDRTAAESWKDNNRTRPLWSPGADRR